jgi:hypothetical protein
MLVVPVVVRHAVAGERAQVLDDSAKAEYFSPVVARFGVALARAPARSGI